MGADVLGGGVMFVIAAALWLVYLVPTWLRRREYLATERNAVRLQQTLRILAETAEVPRQVHVEATAKTVSVQKQLLREAEAHAKAESRAAAEAVSRLRRAESARRVQAARQLGSSPSGGQTHQRSVRRRRLLATGLVSLSLAGLIVGSVLVIATGLWGVLAGAAATMVIGVITQVRLARVPAASPSPMEATRGHSETVLDSAEFTEPALERAAVPWTPVPLPQPLHLTRGTLAADAMASREAGAELEQAVKKAELERRAAQLRPEPPRIPVAPARETTGAKPAESRPPSRFARMGLVDGDGVGGLDLDAVLNRRRAG